MLVGHRAGLTKLKQQQTDAADACELNSVQRMPASAHVTSVVGMHNYVYHRSTALNEENLPKQRINSPRKCL